MKRPSKHEMGPCKESIGLLDQRVFEDAPIGMALVTPPGRFAKVNRAFCRFLGYTSRELIGKTIRDITHPDDWQESDKAITRLRRFDTPLRGLEKRYIHKNGRILWGAVSSHTIRTPGGGTCGSIAQIVDITARKEAEARLKASEERYKIWLEAIPMLAWRCDPQGKCIDCNQRWLRYTGHTLDQVRGNGWMKAVHPQDRARVMKKVRDDVTGGEFYECEYRLRRAADGAYRWHLARAYPLKDHNGQILMWLGAAPDIEALKQANESLRISEMRFRIALEGSPTTVFTQDRNLRYTWAYNPTSGYDIQGIIGKKDSELMSEPSARTVSRIKRQVLRTGASRRDEVTIRSRVGESVFDMITEPLRDDAGRIIGVICAATDITNSKRMEQQLKHDQQNLEQEVKERTAKLRSLALELTKAEQSERRRIAHVLHEGLQQHLVAIQFRINELKGDHSAAFVTSSANWLMEEIAQVIQLSRDLTTHLRPPVLYEFGLRPALGWLAADMKTQFGFSITIRGLPSFQLESDEVRIFAFEAVRELLMNVIKHAGVKAATIRIHRPARRRVAVEVSDKGAGFDSARTIERKFGLFSIRERIHALGGDFTIVSRPGKGTRATLHLPAV